MSKTVIQKITDFETKKCIHINLTKGTHSAFRKELFEHSLSMQEVLEYFATLAGRHDDRAIEMIFEVKNIKRTKTLEKLNKNEVDDLYDAISHVDPFNKKF